MSDFFEEVSAGHPDPKRIANFILSEVKKYLNQHSSDIDELNVEAADLRRLIDLIDEGKISGKIAKDVFVDMADTGKKADKIIEEKGLIQIDDTDAITAAVEEVVRENPASVEDYLNGKEKAIGFLMGQVMKKTKGKANPQSAMKLLKSRLS